MDSLTCGGKTVRLISVGCRCSSESEELGHLENPLDVIEEAEARKAVVTNVLIIVKLINLAFLGSCVDLNTTCPIQ